MIKVNRENKAWKIAKIAIAIVLVVMCALTIVAAASGATYDVTIIENGESIKLTTKSETLTEVLKEAQIKTDSNDIVVADPFVPGNPVTIVINRGYNVTVTYHGETFRTVGYENVGNVIAKEKLEIGERDAVNFPLDKKLSEGMEIIIQAPVKVTIVADGVSVETEALGERVEAVLAKNGVSLGEHDVVEPDRNTVIRESTTIVIKRVTIEERTLTETIAYNTVYVDNENMLSGSVNVKTAGVNGEKAIVYQDAYVDGVFVATKVMSETVVREPVDKVIVRGTKKPQTNNVSANVTVSNTQSIKTISNFTLPSEYKIGSDLAPTSYKKKYVGPGTAYYGGTSTSTGRKPQPGIIAVNPNIIPYGSKLWVVSNDGKFVYGYAIAGDTGGFAYNGSGIIGDLYFSTRDECVQFGRRDITIYVLD